MTNIVNTFSVSDGIQVIGILISLFTSIVAIVVSVKTLKQNNQMIEDASRPYITIYSSVTNFQEPSYYLVLKNFGQSGACITRFSCNRDLSKYSERDIVIPFENIVGTFLSPGQTLYTCIDHLKLFEDKSPLLFDIEYKLSAHTYTESISVNILADQDMVHTRAATDNRELRAISYSLQEIAERML